MSNRPLGWIISNVQAEQKTDERRTILQVAMLDEANIHKLANAFFVATTKESEDDDDILPQVGLFQRDESS